MLNEKQKEKIIKVLNTNTPNAVAYYLRMTFRKQESRVWPEMFETCTDILQEFGAKHLEESVSSIPWEENAIFRSIVDDATASLIGEEKPNMFSSFMENLSKYFVEEKKPNTGHDGLQKQYFNNTAQIFMNHYSKSPSVAAEYTKIALKDFPGLEDKDIDIVVFGGQSKKGCMGIRFRIPDNKKIPSDYFEWTDPYNLDELIY